MTMRAPSRSVSRGHIRVCRTLRCTVDTPGEDSKGPYVTESAKFLGTELLWELGDQGRVATRPTLTVPRIAAAGIALADEAGMTAVSMQQVAGMLDVTKMALYRHVTNKAE